MNKRKKRKKTISGKNQTRNQGQMKQRVETIAFQPPIIDPASLITRLTTIAKKVDLNTIRNQLVEINQICEQVGGVINQIGQWNRPANYNPQNNRQVYQPHYFSPPVQPYSSLPPHPGEKRTFH